MFWLIYRELTCKLSPWVAMSLCFHTVVALSLNATPLLEWFFFFIALGFCSPGIFCLGEKKTNLWLALPHVFWFTNCLHLFPLSSMCFSSLCLLCIMPMCLCPLVNRLIYLLVLLVIFCAYLDSHIFICHYIIICYFLFLLYKIIQLIICHLFSLSFLCHYI